MLDNDYADDEEKDMILMNVQGFEESIYTNRFLRGPGNELESTLYDRLSQLRRYEFAARYGDYAKKVCDDVKTAALEHDRILPDAFWLESILDRHPSGP